MKQLFLLDQVQQSVVLSVTDPEEAVKWLGSLISLTGVESCVGRYVLVDKPRKSGKSLIEYSSDELLRRALVYVNHDILQKRTADKKIGKWARY